MKQFIENDSPITDSVEKPESTESSMLPQSSLLPQRVLAMPARHFINWVLRLPRLDLIKPILDAGLIVLGALWAWLVSFGQVVNLGSPLPFLLVVVTIRLSLYFIFKLHRSSWTHVSRFEVLTLTLTAFLGAPLIGAALIVLPEPFTIGLLTRPLLLLTTEPVFYLMLLFAARMTARAMTYSSDAAGARRILIVGAGDAGKGLAFQIQESRNNYHIVGFLDDDPQKIHRNFRGVSVLGPIERLVEIASENEIQEIVVAISALSPDLLRRLISDSETCKLPLRILPPITHLIGGRANLHALREVRMEDLLPRPEVQLDRASIAAYLSGHTVLVTGGGGSIGGELCRQVLGAGATRLLVLGRGENSVFEMVQELKEYQSTCEIIPVICDVRDRGALEHVFQQNQIDVVFHAAAHKHVPLMESYPCEAVKNNVLGTLNLVELSIQYRIARFVMVSTDKAVEPTNVMGATKRIGELIVNGYAKKHNANMVCVRFGNVLGSRGSVVLTMKKQIKNGKPVTVTDPDMVRYFMTIPEAVQLILQAGSIGGCGEIFVLDMGHPVRILDLAHDLIRLSGLIPNQDIPINIIGRRPGEKVKEDILSHAESEHVEKNGPFFMAPPRPIEFDLVLQQIGQLRVISTRNETEQTVSLIQQMVPEYKPDEKPAYRLTKIKDGVDISATAVAV